MTVGWGTLRQHPRDLHHDWAAGGSVITVRASCLHSQHVNDTGVSLGGRARDTVSLPYTTSVPPCSLVPSARGGPALLGTHHLTLFPPARVHPAHSLA